MTTAGPAPHVALDKVPAGSPGSRWASICAADGTAVEETVLTDGAVAWCGNPWGRDWSVAGRPDGVAALVRLLRREPGVGHLVLPAALTDVAPAPVVAEFAVRSLETAPSAGRSEPPGRARALADGDPRVAALLAAHFPDAEAGPDDPRAGAWTGWEVDSRLVAACCRLRTGPDLALLSSLTLESGWGGRGVARALTRAWAADALAGGARLVALGHHTSNTRASRVYDALGMTREDLVMSGAAHP